MKITFVSKEIKGKKLAKVETVDGAKVSIFERSDGGYSIKIGVGERGKMDLRKLVILPRKIVRKAKEGKIEKIYINFSDFLFSEIPSDPEEVASILGQNFVLANYKFDKFKTKRDNSSIKEIIVSGKINSKIKAGFRKGLVIGEEVNRSRELANTPGGDLTPSTLASKARACVKGLPVKVTVLDKKKMESLKMGAILGVTKGSKEKPAFIVMEYRGKSGKGSIQKGDGPVVFVGKGITFDTGGLSIKTGNSMVGMHLDMSGGAAVIHAVALAARLKLKRDVVGLVPAVENMPSGESFRPGDILRSMSGKTIEVLNTDAEGRLVLADALTYAEKYDPSLVVDVATLTGAACVALGDKASAFFTKDKDLEEKISQYGEESGDYVWPLPLWDEYEEDIKGNFADWANISNKMSSEGGAIHAAIFLYQFAQNYKWAHIDIAPRMTENQQDRLSKGSVGAPIRLLIKLLEKFN